MCVCVCVCVYLCVSVYVCVYAYDCVCLIQIIISTCISTINIYIKFNHMYLNTQNENNGGNLINSVSY